MSKKITLIAPSRYKKEIDNFLPQNLSLGYIASYLEKGGHEIFTINALAKGWDTRNFLKELGVFKRGLSFENIIDRIPPNSDFVGITVPFAASMRIATRLACLVKKKYPAIVTVLGGISPSINPEEPLSEESVGYVGRGGGEIPMLNFALGKEPEKIKGLVFKNGSELFNNGKAEIIEDLVSFYVFITYAKAWETRIGEGKLVD